VRAAFVAVAAVALALAAACGDDDADLADDLRTLELRSVTENAVDALRDGRPELCRAWFSDELRRRCSADRLAEVLEDARLPASLKELKAVEFSDGQARVKLALVDSDGKNYEEEWLFVQGSQGEWSLDDIPAVRDCGR
jgi:hypothetical protein